MPAEELGKRSDRTFEIVSHTNHIEFHGHFDITQFRRALAAMYETTQSRGYQDVVLDFSDCRFTHAPPMLALAVAAEHYRLHGRIDFELVLPKEEKIERLFRNSNWAHLIEPTKYPSSDFKSSVHMPALRYKTTDLLP